MFERQGPKFNSTFDPVSPPPVKPPKADPPVRTPKIDQSEFSGRMRKLVPVRSMYDPVPKITFKQSTEPEDQPDGNL